MLVLGGVAAAGCDLSTGPGGPFADVQGTWEFGGQQSAPLRQLTGTLTITTQDNADVTGQLAFESNDGAGGVTIDGGMVVGRVIGLADIDFDVLLASGTRRHVGRISAGRDSLIGAWVNVASGTAGEFLATRVLP